MKKPEGKTKGTIDIILEAIQYAEELRESTQTLATIATTSGRKIIIMSEEQFNLITGRKVGQRAPSNQKGKETKLVPNRKEAKPKT